MLRTSSSSIVFLFFRSSFAPQILRSADLMRQVQERLRRTRQTRLATGYVVFVEKCVHEGADTLATLGHWGSRSCYASAGTLCHRISEHTM